MTYMKKPRPIKHLEIDYEDEVYMEEDDEVDSNLGEVRPKEVKKNE